MNVIPFASAARLSVSVDEIALQADDLLRAEHGDKEAAVVDCKTRVFCADGQENVEFWQAVLLELEAR